MSATRLVRYASFLSFFDYTIEHRNVEFHANVDHLSRAPLQLKEEFQNCEDYNTVFYNEIV